MPRAAVTPSPHSPEGTAVVLVWLRGGTSHLDSSDPKPEARRRRRRSQGRHESRSVRPLVELGRVT